MDLLKKLDYAKIVWFGVNLFAVFWFIIPHVSGPIYTKCVRYSVCSRYVRSSGWPFYYSVDLADSQWRDIRGNLGLLWICLIGISFLHWLMRYIVRKSTDSNIFACRTCWFRFVVGVIFLYVLHGEHMYIVLVLSLTSYALAMHLNGCKGARGFTWIFAVCLLLIKESYRIKESLDFEIIYWMFDRSHGKGGIYAWQFPANFLVLRIISFSIDYHNAVRYEEEKCSGTSLPDASNSTSPTFHRPLVEYQNVVYFLAYILYVPLYMAGPIISYNAFIYYAHDPSLIQENVLIYGLRWIGCFFIMEYLLNHYPFFAIIQSGLFPYLNINEMIVVAYMTLQMMWLKFLLIWRFFRLWALADGCNPPENMLKCMSNNCSLEEFWRNWHASFNQFLIKYMYIPLGGRSANLLNIWLIFLFVAIWHDIEMKLISWGILNAVFYIIEIYGKRWIHSDFVLRNFSNNVIQMIGMFSAATYIIVLVLVNLLGYSMIGTDGPSIIFQKLTAYEGIRALAICYYFLIVGVNIMLFVDELKGNGKISSKSR